MRAESNVLNEKFVRAARKGNFETIKTLLEQGVDPNSRDINGWTALHESAGYCHTSTVKLLLDYGANVNTVVHDQAPITGAALNGCIDGIRLLLKLLKEFGAQ